MKTLLIVVIVLNLISVTIYIVPYCMMAYVNIKFAIFRWRWKRAARKAKVEKDTHPDDYEICIKDYIEKQLRDKQSRRNIQRLRFSHVADIMSGVKKSPYEPFPGFLSAGEYIKDCITKNNPSFKGEITSDNLFDADILLDSANADGTILFLTQYGRRISENF